MNKRRTFPVSSRVRPRPPTEATPPYDTQATPPSDTQSQQTVARGAAEPDRTAEDQDQNQDQDQDQDQDQNQNQNQNQNQDQDLRIHGLTVERYRDVYGSVLKPHVLAKLSSAKNPDYVAQVLEMKQQLWERLSRPRLVEQVTEDGRVEVTEVLDLT